MAATKGAMTTLPSSQTEYLPSIEEPENNRINFKDSLKFFQEQLVINGANFPSPSSGCPSGNNTLKRNGSFSFKENSLDKGKTSKENDTLKEESQSTRSCKIAIPTVDTILESVRVLRAIQKSQEERGSFWNLDISAKSDIDSYFTYRDDEIPITIANQNGHCNQSSENERYDTTDSTISANKQAENLLINQGVPNTEAETSRFDTNSKDNPTGMSNLKITEETCSFWPSTSLIINSYTETENEVKESTLSLGTESQNVKLEYCKKDSESSVVLPVTELIIKCDFTSDENQNGNRLSGQKGENDKCEIPSENFTENNSTSNERRNDDGNSLGYQEQNDKYKNQLENSTENVSEFKNELNLHERVSNTNSDQLEEKVHQENMVETKENELEIKNNLISIQNDNEISGETGDNNHTNAKSENFIETKTEITNTITKVCDTLESLSEIPVDHDLSFSGEDAAKETPLNELNPNSELLKIETYVDTDIVHKSDVLVSNESLWNDSCSPNDRSSIKTEHNDSDSGFGTQRSASSLSPNNHSQMQKDSWSDSCSSQYASAECSPYHSLSSVFECSSLLSTTDETKANKTVDILSDVTNTAWEDSSTVHDLEKAETVNNEECNLVLQQTNDTESHLIPNVSEKDHLNEVIDVDFNSGNAELDTEISYCNFVPSYTTEHPCKRTEDILQTAQQTYDICDTSENNAEIVNDNESILHEQTVEAEKDEFSLKTNVKENEDDACDLNRSQKFTAASCDLISIVQSLYTIKENPAYQILPALDENEEKFEKELFILSKNEFCEFPEDNYLVSIKDSIMYIKKDSKLICSLSMKYGEVSIVTKTVLKIDNKMGKSVYIQSDADNLMHLKNRIEVNILKHWQTDCLQLVHYPLKYHQNVVIVDLGSCSTRAGILMDQPTLPSLFFPTICATNKTTGTNIYGMEALQTEVRQHSNLSFPVRPTIKITKHTIDINLLEGLFKKIFSDLKVDPTEYTIQVCLPRNLSINAQTALMKLLLEDLKVQAVSLTNQALLTLYAHEVSTAVVVDIGDRIDVLPVVDGFIVENGVTKLPHGGQRLIHHMKHGLAEKRISLSNEIDSFIVQYIIENLAYVAEDYEKEMQIATQYPERIKKTITLQPMSSENLPCKSITLEEARFKIPEGLFNPDLWGLDSPGIHHLVQKAIQATSVDARKQIAENIYVSGGVTMLPGFVERLSKEMIKLSKTKIVPKVHASNYRYHCTYIGACKFAKMGVFPQVCVNLEDYSRNGASVLKKCALCF